MGEISPPFNFDFVYGKFQKLGERYMKKIAGKIEILNKERIKKIKEYERIFYVANHTSMIDYFAPQYAILCEGLPYPRTIAGANLNNLLVKYFIFDFSKWGVIWHDRSNNSPSKIKEYILAIENSLREGSILAFPEGKRNRNPERGLLEFKNALFNIMLSASQKTNSDLKVCCISILHEKIPEKDYYDKIDNSAFGKAGYYFWDIYANLKWKWLVSDKGATKINFAEPVKLEEIACGKNKKEKAKNSAEYCRKRIEDLLEETRNTF